MDYALFLGIAAFLLIFFLVSYVKSPPSQAYLMVKILPEVSHNFRCRYARNYESQHACGINRQKHSIRCRSGAYG